MNHLKKIKKIRNLISPSSITSIELDVGFSRCTSRSTLPILENESNCKRDDEDIICIKSLEVVGTT